MWKANRPYAHGFPCSCQVLPQVSWRLPSAVPVTLKMAASTLSCLESITARLGACLPLSQRLTCSPTCFAIEGSRVFHAAIRVDS